MNQQYRIGKILLKIITCTLIVWAFVPCFSAYMPSLVRYAIIMFLFLGSLLSAIMVNPSKQHFIKKGLLFFSIILFLLLMYMGKWRYQGSDFISYFCTAYLFWVPIFIFDVILLLPERDIKQMRMVLFGCILVTIATTIIGSSVYPEASRLLSQGYNTKMDEIFGKANIGGYGFIYGIVLLLPIVLYEYSVAKNKLFIIAIIVGSILATIYAQYSIALVLIVIVFIAYLVLKNGNIQKALLFTFIGIALFVLLRESIITMLGILQQEFSNSGFGYISDRIVLITKILDGSGFQGDAIARQNLYLRSWNAFLKNPIIGSILEQHQLGRHSELLDVLGATGIVGFTLFSTVWYRGIKQVFNKLNHIQCVYYGITCIVLGVLFYLNTIFTSPEITVVIFIAPIIIFRYKLNDSIENDNNRFEVM